MICNVGYFQIRDTFFLMCQISKLYGKIKIKFIRVYKHLKLKYFFYKLAKFSFILQRFFYMLKSLNR